MVSAITAIAVYFFGQNTKEREASSLRARLLPQATAAAKQAGCPGVQTIAPYAGDDRQHVPAIPPLRTYTSQPPTSGPHEITPLNAGGYSSPPDMGKAIHSLEHGAAIVWYEPSASGTELNSITSFFGDPAHQDHVIVAPYDYPDQGSAGRFPAGKQMVLVAWHHIQECSGLSLAVAFDFVAHYRFPPPVGESYQGDAPEQGVPI